MGIQLDWEVEAEHTARRSISEDPDARRQRRMGAARMILTFGLLTIIAGGIAFFIVRQIDRINERIETNLRDTVQAEITALRIGDWNAYSRFQRSASEDWVRIQRTQFERYQDILLNSENTQLTGQILDVTIDGPRARVKVQEIIDGVPYTRVWFYWLYEPIIDDEGRELMAGGWYHVPPDYTFWGNSQLFEGDYVTVAYRDVDADFGASLGQSLDDWAAFACESFNCDDLPHIRVQVAPQDSIELAWAPGDVLTEEWVLLISSPFADRARTDMPFSPNLRVETATLLAERLTAFQANNQRMLTIDASYNHQAVITWLVGRFVQINTGAYFVESLVAGYGQGTVGELIRRTPPTADSGFISEITGAPLDASGLDWRDFFTWRLRQEYALWERGLLNDYLMLYDGDDADIQQGARERFEGGIESGEWEVVSVGTTSPTADGQTQVLATVMTPDEATFQVVFRLVDNHWLRAS